MSTVLQTVGEETSLPGKRFWVQEYHRMIAGGVFAEDERYELLDGVITPKMAKNPPHDGTIGLLSELLRPLLPPDSTLRIQSAITTLDSEPEPDLAIVRGPAPSWLESTPTGGGHRPGGGGGGRLARPRSRAQGPDSTRVPASRPTGSSTSPSAVSKFTRTPSGPGPEPCYRRRSDFPSDGEIALNWGNAGAKLRLADLFRASR